MEPFSILNKTSKYGVILFLASAAFLTIGEFTKGIAWLSFLLGTVKLILCIWILYYAMREYARHFNLYRASRVFSYGFGISIMANLAYCIYMLLHYSVFFPIDESQIRSIVDAMDMGSMEGMEGMDINQIVDIIVGNYPENDFRLDNLPDFLQPDSHFDHSAVRKIEKPFQGQKIGPGRHNLIHNGPIYCNFSI